MLVIFCALPEELRGFDARQAVEVVYTGIGKINATLTAARYLASTRPQAAINFGTAGAVDPNFHGLIECGSAVQRDFDLRALGVPLGAPLGHREAERVHWGQGACVGSGDQFSTQAPEVVCDLVDMEAFALAKTCAAFKVPFRCVKYVSDYADEAAAEAWQEKTSHGADLFSDWLDQLDLS